MLLFESFSEEVDIHEEFVEEGIAAILHTILFVRGMFFSRFILAVILLFLILHKLAPLYRGASKAPKDLKAVDHTCDRYQ